MWRRWRSEGLVDQSPHFRLEVLAGGLGWLSDNQRLHWAVKNQRTQGWRLATFLMARMRKTPRLVKARVVCQLRFTDVRRRDPNNWAPTAKACLDGLVDAGVFVDDDWKHVIGPDMRLGPQVSREYRGVHLYLFPMEE